MIKPQYIFSENVCKYIENIFVNFIRLKYSLFISIEMEIRLCERDLCPQYMVANSENTAYGIDNIEFHVAILLQNMPQHTTRGLDNIASPPGRRFKLKAHKISCVHSYYLPDQVSACCHLQCKFSEVFLDYKSCYGYQAAKLTAVGTWTARLKIMHASTVFTICSYGRD